MDIYKIADLNIGIENHREFTKKYMRDYLTDEQNIDFSVIVTPQMIIEEEKIAVEKVPQQYYELTAILRVICKKIVRDYNGFFLHCSCLKYKDEAIVFTAKSGTGKSTHSRLWREKLNNQVEMINDDKPIVRLIDDVFYIYGTPWNGKHSLSNNIKAPIKAIYYLHQAENNKVSQCDPISSITKILSQTVLPDDKASMDNLLSMTEKLVSTTPVSDLDCNISYEAVDVVLNSLNEI